MTSGEPNKWRYFWKDIGKAMGCVAINAVFAYLYVTADSWAPYTRPLTFGRFVEIALVFLAGLVWMFIFGGIIIFLNEAIIDYRAITRTSSRSRDELFLRKLRRAAFHAIWASWLIAGWFEEARFIWIGGGAFALWFFLFHSDPD